MGIGIFGDVKTVPLGTDIVYFEFDLRRLKTQALIIPLLGDVSNDLTIRPLMN